MRPLNPPFSTPGPMAEKSHRQAWSDAERKQVCEYAEAQHKFHGTDYPGSRLSPGGRPKSGQGMFVCC